MVHLLGRGEADTIPRRPAIHLGLGAAAKAKQLRPELLNEVQQTRNRGFLLLISTTEREARDMYVQTTGSGGVAVVVEFLLCEAPSPTAFRSNGIQASSSA